jgi:myo-inositol 2-dehydrogenase/D-chiro-inositol 1-dehydrogenase
MSKTPSRSSRHTVDRRRFLKTGSVVTAGTIAASTLVSSRMVHAAGSDILKVGLIGCGGRGMGAAQDAMNADKNAQLVAICDLFPDRAQYAHKVLKNQLGEQFQVAEDRVYHDFDGYQKLIASDVDVVLLCTTPHFRPAHLRAAVEAGKHVFCEKPVAVDAPGVRSVLESSEMAKSKGLALVSGLCWRYDYAVKATMDQIKSGAIGDIVSIQENYLTGPLWHRGRKPEWSEMEYQQRNWYYFTWLSGDHNVEQHIHSLDKAMWLMDDKPPVKAVGLGGRQVRTGPEWGNIFDHHAVIYEWANGVKCHAYTRQQAGCFNETDDFVYGTKGIARVLQFTVNGEKKWRYEGEQPSMYLVEHQELFKSIREGKPINNGTYMCNSTMLAIMGRMACYTGKEITWDMAMNSQENLTPEKYEWGDVKVPEVPMPGQTEFV